jgi:outer membrane murein-binding lipoprotein Lpp
MDEATKELLNLLRSIIARNTDVIIQMTASANVLSTAVDELTSAVATLTAAVGHLEKKVAHEAGE